MNDSTTTPDVFMLSLLRLTGFFQRAGKTRTLIVIILLILAAALTDWRAGTNVSAGLLYAIPLAVGATVFRPKSVAILSGICAILGVVFYHPDSDLQTTLHFFFALTANMCAGMLVHTALRNHQLTRNFFAPQTSEEEFREAGDNQFRALADTGAAAVVTLDEQGLVLAANNAAEALFGVKQGESLRAQAICGYLPALSSALRIANGKTPMHAAAQCQGTRQNGEIFLASVWYSIYPAREKMRLSAIIVDSSEEMRDREQHQLHEVAISNRVTVAAVSHEIRNFCSAISQVYSNLKQNPQFLADRRFQSLGSLVQSLEKVAVSDLRSNVQEELEEVPLSQVLNDLRIVVDPDWKEIAGTVSWLLPEKIPAVVGKRHGLLQVFLNLSQNSRQAVKNLARRELTIEVAHEKHRVVVHFRDSGPGIADPQLLFQPFASGSGGTGIGLYVSRAILRHYGGELRCEPQPAGASFTVELEAAEGRIDSG